MPSILLPHIIKQQEKMEREIARKGRSLTREGEVVEWWINKMKEEDPELPEEFTRPEEYSCWTYDDYCKYFTDEIYADVPEHLWDWFNFADMIYDTWLQEDGFHLLYDDAGTIVEMDKCEEAYPIWKGRLRKFFTDHPNKRMFYIVRFDN